MRLFSILLFGLVVILIGCIEEPQPPLTYTPPEFEAPEGLLEYVNPFIGTGGFGFGTGATFPGATYPFGIVHLSPDSTENGAHPNVSHFGGYYYKDTQIRGFSHTHLSGAGISDYGNISVMPALAWNDNKYDESNRYLSFTHENESATAGYYEVTFTNGIKVQLTATEHVGVHQYSFPSGSTPTIILDACFQLDPTRNSATDGLIYVDFDEAEISGKMHHKGGYSGRYGGFDLYFAARFDQDFNDYGVWADGTVENGTASITGEDVGAYVSFSSLNNDTLTMLVGISFISIDQARRNIEVQTPNMNFNQIRSEVQQSWIDLLQIIEVTGGTLDQKTKFYTALYHSFISPSVLSEADGYYRGYDQGVHRAVDFKYYSDFSLWDTYRTLHPLLTLIKPDRQLDMLKSLVRIAKEGGYFPRWGLATGYTNGMVGTSADVVIADSYLKGITDFNANFALQQMMVTALEPVPSEHQFSGRNAVEEYSNLGYLPFEASNKGTSKTLEYCYDDFAIAQLAEALNDTSNAAIFYDRSRFYQNIWNTDEACFASKNRDGDFIHGFDSNVFSEYYTEGNSWHYRFFVPYDPDGLLQLFNESGIDFYTSLDEFFNKSTINNAEPTYNDNNFPDEYYWHGNEPDIHSVYLFNYTDRPDRTQFYVRKIMKSKYFNDPAGIPGNDDLGTLSAWYVFSAMGIFPIAGTDYYLLGSPIFDNIVIHLPEGEFYISAQGSSDTVLYVKQARLNAIPLENLWIYHDDIVEGAWLDFNMQASPPR